MCMVHRGIVVLERRMGGGGGFWIGTYIKYTETCLTIKALRGKNHTHTWV